MKSLGRMENLTTAIGAVFPDATEGEIFTLQGHETLIDGLYLFVNGEWSLIGETAVAKIVSLDTVNGQALNTFIDSSRGNKTLSVDNTQLVYGHTVVKNNTWMGTAVSKGATAGYEVPLDGTVTMVTIQSNNINNSSVDMDLYKNGILISTICNISGSGNVPSSNRNTSLDINFNQGDMLQLRGKLVSGSKVREVAVIVYVKWRSN